MNKRNYIVPETHHILIYMKKNICDGGVPMGDDPLIGNYSGSGGVDAEPAPGRVRLYN